MSAWTDPCPTRLRLWTTAVVIYLVALTARGTVYYESKDWPLFVKPQIDEYTAYHIGLAFLDDKLPPEVYLKGPLYMWFVGGVAWLFGRDPMRVRLIQVFLSGLSPMLVYLIGDRVFGRRIGIIAGLMTALFWTLVYYSVVLVDAAVTTALYLLLLCLLVRLDDERWWKWPLCGMVLAIGALSRPSILAFAPLLALIVLLIAWRRIPVRASLSGERRRSWVDFRPVGARIALLALGCILVIAPVTARNRIVGKEWVLIGAYGGQNLWIANSPRSDGKNVPILMEDGVPKVSPVEPNDIWTSISLGNRIARYYAEQAMGRRLRFGEIDAYFGRIGREWILHHPGEFLIKTLKRFCFFLNAHEYPNEADIYWFREASRLIKCLSYVHFGVVCPLAVFGLALAVGGRNRTAPLAYTTGMLASLWLPGLFFVINARFRIVIVPLLILFAAYGLVRLVGFFRKGIPATHRMLAILSIAGLAVFSNVNWFGYAEKHYTDHRMAFAVACEQAGRNDLLPAAVARLSAALDEDLKTGRLTQTAVMDHVHPIGWVFVHYYRLGDKSRALHYGSLMIRHDVEPIPLLVLTFCHMAMDAGRKNEARQALDLIRRDAGGCNPEDVISCLARFGEIYMDKAALTEALSMLNTVRLQNPADPNHQNMRTRVRSLLQDMGVSVTSATSTIPASTPTGGTPLRR